MLRVSGGTIAYENRVDGRLFSLEVPSFRLNDGSLLWLRGANGCGKSSLLAVIAGHDRPNLVTDVEAEWVRDGKAQPARAVASFCGANPAMLPSRSVRDYIRYAGYCAPERACLAASEAASRLREAGLEDKLHRATPDMLSTGQRKRAVLARIAVQGLPLLLLDEPTANLDENAEQLLRAVVEGRVQSRGVVLIASHDPDLGLPVTAMATIRRLGPQSYRMTLE